MAIRQREPSSANPHNPHGTFVLQTDSMRRFPPAHGGDPLPLFRGCRQATGGSIGTIGKLGAAHSGLLHVGGVDSLCGMAHSRSSAACPMGQMASRPPDFGSARLGRHSGAHRGFLPVLVRPPHHRSLLEHPHRNKAGAPARDPRSLRLHPPSALHRAVSRLSRNAARAAVLDADGMVSGVRRFVPAVREGRGKHHGTRFWRNIPGLPPPDGDVSSPMAKDLGRCPACRDRMARGAQ